MDRGLVREACTALLTQSTIPEPDFVGVMTLAEAT